MVLSSTGSFWASLAGSGIVFVLCLTLFVLLGSGLFRSVCPKASSRDLLVLGWPVGMAFGALWCAVIGWQCGFNTKYISGSIIIASGILWFVGRVRRPVGSERHVLCEGNPWMFIIPLLVALLVVLALTGFGKMTDRGLMFKDLYATDLLHHMSVFVHLPNGIPPVNPYFTGEPWRYYWTSHLVPAFMYSISGFAVSPMRLTVLLAAAYSVMFVLLLQVVVSTHFKDKRVQVVLVSIAIIAYGYNDLFLLVKILIGTLSEEIVRAWRLDYILVDTRGEQFTGYSHGWFRNFLVEPHSTLAISLLFVVVILARREGGVLVQSGRDVLTGVVLGLMASIDAFIGVIAITWYVSVIVYSRWTAGKELVWDVARVCAPIAVVGGILLGLKIISPGENHLVVSPNWKMLSIAPFYFLLDFGPLGLLACIGAYWVSKGRQVEGMWLYVPLVVVCLIFMFFVNVTPVGSTQMFRKAGMVIRLPLLVFCGVALECILREKSRNAQCALGLVILLAVPTPFVDIYRLGDEKPSASFISQGDLSAQNWIRENVAVGSIVQDYPASITPILAFGERGVALGDWEHAKSSGVVVEKVAERFQRIRELFETEDPMVAHNIARGMSISYVYINDYVRERFVKGVSKFEQRPNVFKKVYSSDSVTIYKVVTS